MGRYLFRVPDIGEGIAEAEIVAWHVAVGDQVAEDQIVVDLMTDKATVEICSPVSGTVVAINGALGAMAATGSTLVEFDVAGAGETAPPPVKAEPPAAKKPEPAAKPSPPKLVAVDPAPKPERPPVQMRRAGEKPIAPPAVRRRADEMGVKLAYVPGSGPAGRITHQDLDAYLATGGSENPVRAIPATLERHATEQIKIVGLRRKIAEKMQESKRRIPHFSYIEEIDVTELEALRQHLNATKAPNQPKLTLLPFLITALVKTVPDFPQVNANFDDEAGVVTRYGALHIGMATQTPGGLIVPVIRHAEARDLWGLADEITRLAKATRDGTASRNELSGSTITITSLGPLGGLAHTPVINHPEVAIIGPNKIIERPVVRDGQIVIRKMMNLSSSFDHRVVDGFDAAEFIQAIKRCLEYPATIFIPRGGAR